MEKGPKRSSEDNDSVENDAKRAATLEARMEGIEASIKCVVCENLPRMVPILSCDSGHIICQSCQWKTGSCPKCKNRLPDNMNNPLAEALIRKVEHRCKYKAQGCQVKMLLKDLKTHESDCPDNPDKACIKIKFMDQNNNSQVSFDRVNIVKPMRDLMKKYCEKAGVPVHALRFIFLNNRINDDETPKLLNMMDGDVIYVFHKGKSCFPDDAMYDIVGKISEFESSLKCQIVKFEPYKNPLYLSSCQKGHISFQVYWRPRLTSCVTCGEDLLPIMLPGSSFENVLHKCKFSFNGCKVKMRPKYLEKHESDCPLKGIYCQDKDVIKVKVVGLDSDEVHYRIGKTTEIGWLKNSHCNKMGLPPSSFRFLFDGRRMNDSHTPISLDMENDDVIEVYQAHVGS